MAPPPQATSAATVVIFTLALNMLTAPETSPMESSTAGMCAHDLGMGSGWHAGHLPFLPSSVGSSGASGVLNLTAASPPLLLVLPGEGNQSAWRPSNYRDVNRRIHRPSPSPPPELVIYYGGAPRAQELVSSDLFFGFNLSSLDGTNIQEPHTYNHSLGALVLLFDGRFALIVNQSSDTGSFRRLRTRSRLPAVTFAGGHRKLLGSQGSSSTKRSLIRRRRRQQALLQEPPRVGVAIGRAAAAAAALALFGLLCTIAGLVLWCTRRRRDKLEIDEKLILCPSAPRRYSRRELAAATHGFAEAAKIGRGGFGPVYRGFLADQERHVAIKVLSSSSSVQAQGQGTKEFRAEVEVMTRLRHRNIVQC